MHAGADMHVERSRACRDMLSLKRMLHRVVLKSLPDNLGLHRKGSVHCRETQGLAQRSARALAGNQLLNASQRPVKLEMLSSFSLAPHDSALRRREISSASALIERSTSCRCCCRCCCCSRALPDRLAMGQATYGGFKMKLLVPRQIK